MSDEGRVAIDKRTGRRYIVRGGRLVPMETLPPPPTPLSEASAAFTRGAGPYAAAAGLGAAAGAPLAGVGAVPGALAGMGALGLSQFVGDPVVRSANAAFGTNILPPTEAIQQIMDRLGVPQPQTPGGRIAQTGVETAAGALGGVGVGKTLERFGGPVTQRVGSILAEKPGAQALAGGAAGAASQAAADITDNPLMQLAASLGAGYAAGATGSRIGGARMASQAPLRADIAEAERRGIPVMTSDIRSPNSFITQNIRRIGESIPFLGTGGMRSRQEEQRLAAIRNTLDQFGVQPGQYGDDVLKNINDDLRATRTAALNAEKKQKMDIINRFASQADPVQPQTALPYIRSQITELQNTSAEETRPIIEALRTAEADLAAGKSLKQIEALREIYFNKFANPDLGAIHTVGDRIMQQMYLRLNQDMGAFIRARGGQSAFDQWKNANRTLAGMAGQLKVTPLQRALSRGELTPESIRPLLFTKNTSEAKLLYDNLSEAGRAQVRRALLGHAVQRAGNIDDPTAFNANRFESELAKLEPQLRTFFPGSYGAEVDGLRRSLRLTQQATTSAKSGAAPTGLQLLPTATVAGASSMVGGDAVMTGGILAAMGLGARAYESPTVRSLLSRLGKTKPGSPEEAEMYKRLQTALIAQQQTQQQPGGLLGAQYNREAR